MATIQKVLTTAMFFGGNSIKGIERKENKLSFDVTFKADNGEFSATYKSEPLGDKIAGVILTNFGGQENETPFEGSRAATVAADDDDDDDN